MNCEEFQQFQSLYLDSELDNKTTLEVEQHLSSCPGCASAFAEEQRFEAQLNEVLRNGKRTASLWEQVEKSIASRATATLCAPAGTNDFEPRGAESPLPVIQRWLGSLLIPSKAWAGLAAVWVMILFFDVSSRGGDKHLMAEAPAASASAMELALKERRLLMIELAIASEPGDTPTTTRSGPRSDCCNQFSNV